MKKVTIEEVNNGFQVALDGAPYVYKSTEIVEMLERIGKFVLGKKVKVEER